MAGRTRDPKPHRITLRLSDLDVRALTSESRRRKVSIGALVRQLIRQHLKPRRA